MAWPRKRTIDSTESRNELGPRLRVLRREAGLSQTDLAVKLQRAGWDVGKVTISTIENQQRTLTDQEALKILTALKKTWTDL